MAMLQAILLLLCFVGVLSGAYGQRYGDGNRVLKKDAFRVIAASNLNFTNALYQLLSQQEGNVFFSPLSIQVVLALAAQGARGRTEQEMIAGLQLPQDPQTIRDGFRQILSALTRIDGESVKIATKIYTDKRFPPTQEFSRIAQESFQSDGQKVDFNQGSEQARRLINQWVEENTANKITNMLPEGSVTRDTSMVLVNAVYFKSSWLVQFNPEHTKRKAFYVRPGVQTMVNMMQVTEGERYYFREAPELNAKILAMPYIGESINFVIVLPDERFGLQDVERRLVDVDMKILFKQMRTPEVHLEMPKFKMEYSTELNNVLKQLGMQQMFSNAANFSALATGSANGFKVSKVAHKSYLEVNEEGTEAAATTYVKLTKRRGSPPRVPFLVDHPFLFFLCLTEIHADTSEQLESVLFMGRYLEPQD